MEFSLGEATDETRLPAGTTRADFYAARFCISADIFTGDRRLLDVLRDSTRQYLELKRLSVRAVDGDDQRTEYADGLLNKAEIDWVAVRAEPSRAEGRLYGFVKKTPVRVALVVDSHRIEGNVFLEGTGTDPMLFFLRGVEKSSERLLAVGSASITASSGTRDEAGLVIVNRSAVSVFSVVR